MKYWALLTLLLYLAALLILTVPVWWLAFEGLDLVLTVLSAAPRAPKTLAREWEKYSVLYATWQYWVWIGVMVASQAALLFVRVDTTNQEHEPRRNVLIPAAATALLMGVLGLGAVWAIVEERKAEGLFDSDQGFYTVSAQVLLGSWCLWALIFFPYCKRVKTDCVNSRLSRFLLAGSILELLIAIPCHVIVRQRHECCGGILTVLGLSSGLSVMLLAFGPSVYFLYLRRYRLMQGRRGKASRSAIG